MKLLPKIKYFILTSLGFLFVVTPAFASAPVATRANELRTKACQARQEVVKTRMSNLLRMAETMLGVFDKIEARVEEFYQNKVVANGGSSTNYNQLVQVTQEKKSAVEVALNKATSDSSNFSCETEKPKDALVTFRKDMQGVKSALKEYRTSVKNLIVEVAKSHRALPTAVPTQAAQ